VIDLFYALREKHSQHRTKEWKILELLQEKKIKTIVKLKCASS
jgi:hypothetical protein